MTDLGDVRLRRETGEMTLLTVHPGVTIDDVRTNMGWDPRLSGALDETPPPTEDELRLIRTQLDPSGMYTS